MVPSRTVTLHQFGDATPGTSTSSYYHHSLSRESLAAFFYKPCACCTSYIVQAASFQGGKSLAVFRCRPLSRAAQTSPDGCGALCVIYIYSIVTATNNTSAVHTNDLYIE